MHTHRFQTVFDFFNRHPQRRRRSSVSGESTLRWPDRIHARAACIPCSPTTSCSQDWWLMHHLFSTGAGDTTGGRPLCCPPPPIPPAHNDVCYPPPTSALLVVLFPKTRKPPEMLAAIVAELGIRVAAIAAEFPTATKKERKKKITKTNEGVQYQ